MPSNFRFAAKVPRAITHDAACRGAPRSSRRSSPRSTRWERSVGPLLVQLPAEFRRDADTERRLSEFLAAVPAGVKVAVEFRDVSWHSPETCDRLQNARRGAGLDRLARPAERHDQVTADFLYIRWLGVREWVGKYDRVTLDRAAEHDEWERNLRRALPEVREVFGYFNNHWAGHSPASANEMKRRLGLSPSIHASAGTSASCGSARGPPRGGAELDQLGHALPERFQLGSQPLVLGDQVAARARRRGRPPDRRAGPRALERAARESRCRASSRLT